MVDAKTNKAASPTSSAELQPAAVDADKSNASQAQPTGKATAAGPHLAAAVSFDEILAKEALASLKRTRATAREDAVKSKARVLVPPARLVVRPSKSHAWMTPFISLAVIVGISTFLCAGGLAYLFLRPFAAAKASDAELRNIRDSVAQLRRNVAELSNDVATNRTALAAANKAASDRAGRLAQSLDRVERDQPMPATKIERVAEEKVQVARPAPTDLPSDVTGTVQQPSRPTNARREVITGWHVRRAYDSVAILEGQSGVIEVILGQDVPDLGRIQEIKYENGRWQVLTSKGVINPAR
jgi:hypothetical protein